MQTNIFQKLIETGNYTPQSAEVIATQLDSIQYPDLRIAVENWIKRNVEINVGEAPYDTVSLSQNYNMNYPAAILLINLHRMLPEAAKCQLAFWEHIIQ